ncbi:MAG: DUF1697 domain-containing protein [Planctomycetota bacterium]
MTRHVALLRGINVGGKNKLPMKDLAAIFEASGARDIVTYIQSGNVVFTATAALARAIPTVVEDGIEQRFGFRVPMVIRSASHLAAVLAGCPFAGKPTELLHVFFLSAKPTAQVLATLDPAHSPPDEMRVVGQEIWLHCPKGLARSKFTNAWLDRKLGVVSTARNHQTLTKLVELSRS